MKTKKYLTIVLAITISGVFVGCHEDELSGSLIEQKKIAFEDAFIRAFGQPDPTHNWGFRMPGSDESFTRTENANANEWADPDKAYGGLLVPPPLTTEQKAVVKAYFQSVKNIPYNDPQWTNYFIQQVYKGGTDPKTGTDPNTGKSYSPEKYVAADGNTWITGSNNMDHLAAINGTFVDHINNFNHGDCSPNGDVLDNGQHVGGTHHTDKIMYMKNSTTASFGYYNSNGSVRRTEYTGLVSYQTIIDKLGAEANCLNDGWNRSFMGFDFEQMVGPEIITNNKFTWKGKEYPVIAANQNMYCGIPLNCDDTDLQQEGFIDNLLAQGYLPVDGGANKKWVKVGGCADGYYSDWIVCLTKAETDTPTPSTAFLRVMAEDLSANQASDFDFNDVVFDVERVDDGHAKITLQAAGGTLPLRINSENGVGGWEVHTAFDVPINVMVNTNAHLKGLSSANCNPVVLSSNFAGDFSVENFAETVKNIRVEVYKSNTWMELTANRGVACCKFAVSERKPWVDERKEINKKYNFSDWVQGFTTTLTSR